MRRLYILRHATTEPQLTSDFERKLTKYGDEQAEALARFWFEKQYEVDAILCSSAVRAQSTAAPLIRMLSQNTHVNISKEYYNINDEEIVEIIKNINNRFSSVLYIGHNPGITMAAAYLADDLPNALASGFSPGNMCVLEFEVDNWQDVDKYKGIVIDYFIENY